MRMAHDPFRAGRKVLTVPQVGPDTAPVDRPVTVVALVDRYPPTANAGAEWYLQHCLRDSAARGHRVAVVTQAREPYDLDGVRVEPRRRLADLAAVADVLVGHLLWTREVVTAASKGRLPLVYISHNDHQLDHWRVGPPNVTVLVSNARWVAESEAGWEGPHAVVRPPVLAADYALDRDPAAASHVTLVNCYEHKGSATFYALARRQPHRRFLAVEGAYGQQVRPGPGDRNVDWQPQTARIRDDVYACTRVLLMPSDYESWGRTGVEAMASGIPVIAHPTPGLRESLGAAGIFADRADIDAWAAELDRLDDPDEYAAASAAARARAAELDAQARTDLDTWDQARRLAAAAREEPHDMPTPHNPFAPHRRQALLGVTPADPDAEGDTADPPGGGDPADPASPDGADTTSRPAGVPERAADVVDWLAEADGDEALARAEAALAAEEARDGEPRKTVMAEVDRILGER